MQFGLNKQNTLLLINKKGRISGLFCGVTPELAEVFANEAGKFKHGDLRFAENCFEFVIRIDVAFVDFVLQVVFFDVNPEFAHNFSAWQWVRTNHSS